MTSSPSRLLVIGVGNRDRGDDAAGPIVCDLLVDRQLTGVETVVYEGSVLDLAMVWQADDRVVIVDAAAPAGEPGRIREVDGLNERLLAPGAVSTHTIDVSAAIELGRALDQLPAALAIIGVEGDEFDFGAELTPAVARAVDQVVADITRRARPPTGDGLSAAAS